MSGEYKKGNDDETVVDGLIEMYCPTCERSFSATATYCPEDNAKLIRLFEGADPLLGAVIDERFLLKSRLGAGGMGVVYAAVDQRSGREAAVKLIVPEKASDRDLSKRFLREAKLLSRLGHANTVSILDFGQDSGGALFLVMELLHGIDLAVALRQSGPMPVERIRNIGMQLCGALEAAHNIGVVHRDLKPANIILTTGALGEEHVKVLDFGIAKNLYGNSTEITETDMIVGTPSYLPPETALGMDIDARSDLYSLGVILYELTEGTLPFRTDSAPNMLRAHVAATPRPMKREVPEVLSALIFQLLAKRPEDRPASAAEVRERLRLLGPQVLATIPTPIPTPLPIGSPGAAYSHTGSARGPSPVGDSGRRFQRISTAQRPMHNTKFIGLALASAGLIVGLALYWSRPRGSNASREPAEGLVAVEGDAVVAKSPDASASTQTVAQATETTPTETTLTETTLGRDDTASAGPPAGPTEASIAEPKEPRLKEPSVESSDRIVFELSSDPDGAAVVLGRDGQPDLLLCEATPCTVAVPNLDGRGVLQFRRRDYASHAATIDLRPGSLVHRARLQRQRASTPQASEQKKAARPLPKTTPFRPKGDFLSPKKRPSP